MQPATSTESYPAPDSLADVRELESEVVTTVRRWLGDAERYHPDKAATRLATLLKDPRGLTFAVGFVDGVIRPEDPRAGARNLAAVAREVPQSLPVHLRLALRLGAAVAQLAPRLVVPCGRLVLRHMVRHLVVDARPRRLGRAIRRLHGEGVSLNINLLGEAVLGEREAQRRLAGSRALLARPDVDYVSLKVSSVVAPQSVWAFDEAVEKISAALAQLFHAAARADRPKFINLDMEEYHDLELTSAVFTRVLEMPGLHDFCAGIVLQAYLPDALQIMIRLQEWAAQRVADGGAPVKIRIVKGANLPMERVEASVHGWPLAVWPSKVETDTNYKRLLDYALHPERVRNVRIGVAGHNLFDVAFAWLLAHQRGVAHGVDFEMLLGMAVGQAQAVRRDVGELLIYTPVVQPAEFDVAISYLVRRLEEGASAENFMSAVFDLHDDERLFEQERARFAASLAALDRDIPRSRRTQDRVVDEPAVHGPGFANSADTDPSIPANQRWARAIMTRARSSQLGVELVAAAAITTAEQLELCVAHAVGASVSWGQRPGAARADVLQSAAVELERRRDQLIEVMAAECGKTFDQADPEVSEAVDFANYYATLAGGLDAVDGAEHLPVRLTLVTPPWNFPVAIPAGSTLAALAAGSAVLLKAAPQARRCAAVLVAALHAAGVPEQVLRLVDVDEGELGRALVSDPRVDRLILTGAWDTAVLFREFRADLPLLAETSGKNAVVVTDSADMDLAVRDVVASAFGHAGQKCSAASLVVLVGPVAHSARFRRQLIDAVQSIEVGPAWDLTSQMGPLIEPAAGKLHDALTRLAPGESWLVRPQRLDDDGRSWSPGVKTGVAPGSDFHLTEYFGPVLGIMTAPTLAEAIQLQNAVPYGLTAGLHSLDPGEIEQWIESVEAGNLYVNRGITGAIVRRQPFGGWKRSAVGAGTKAGGPNYLVGLSDWLPAQSGSTTPPTPVQQRLLAAARASGVENVAALARAFASDADAWHEEFGVVRDASTLSAERNLLRYRPHPVTIRFEADRPAELLRVVGAGLQAGALVEVSTRDELATGLLDIGLLVTLRGCGVVVHIESAARLAQRLAPRGNCRVRLIGAAAADLPAELAARPDVAVYAQPVTEAGRIESLPFLQEQAISITAHRFGTHNALTEKFLPVTG